MRFELKLIPNNKVEIIDRFYVRESVIVPNNDRCIRDGIKTFYHMDAFYLDMEEAEQKQYVACRMGELPKEDLSFKEVKKID